MTFVTEWCSDSIMLLAIPVICIFQVKKKKNQHNYLGRRKQNSRQTAVRYSFPVVKPGDIPQGTVPLESV